MKLHVLAAALAVLLLGAAAAEAADNSAALDLIRRECSTCHGTQGVSVSPTFPNLAGQTHQLSGAGRWRAVAAREARMQPASAAATGYSSWPLFERHT